MKGHNLSGQYINFGTSININTYSNDIYLYQSFFATEYYYGGTILVYYMALGDIWAIPGSSGAVRVSTMCSSSSSRFKLS